MMQTWQGFRRVTRISFPRNRAPHDLRSDVKAESVAASLSSLNPVPRHRMRK